MSRTGIVARLVGWFGAAYLVAQALVGMVAAIIILPNILFK